MASAQVLRKQEHLEAGKKKLEEFRRKKAAEKAKKTASSLQLHVSKGVLHEKQLSETELLFLPDSNEVGISDDLSEGHSEPSHVFEKNEIKESDVANKSDFSSSGHTNAKLSFLTSNDDDNSSVLEHSYLIGDEYKGDAASVGLDKPESANFKFCSEKDDVSSSQVASGIGNDQSLAYRISSNQEIYHASGHSSDSGLDDYPSTYSNGPEKDLLLGNSGTSVFFTQNHLPETSIRALLQDKFGNSGHQDNGLTSLLNQDPVSSAATMMDNSAFGGRQKFSELSDMVEKKSAGFAAQTGRVDYSPPLTSDHRYIDYNSDAQSSSSHAPLSTPAAGRRSRPSFLDSIHILKGPSSPLLFGAAKSHSSTSKVYPMDSLGSLVSQKSVNSFIASGEGAGMFNHVLENKHDFFSQKQNEDFAALEQHIEDLTQEKFSLQRTLESSRALTESLASENSTLTESFNQQGSIVNQLKFDLEKLQEEIKAQLVELKAVKIDYANAQLECNAADERAKLLASEVIGLEEKALRLRSNELKLERQLESSQAEISSCRKKMSSLEKDRQDLQSTIDALQEEKKLLQAKLRKASASGKSVGDNNTSLNKKDVSTSTEDVVDTITETSNSDNHGTAFLGDDASTSQFQHENVQLSLKRLPSTIPSDQIRMIQNINTLTAELVQEKDQLVRALSAESSQRSKLSELNKELTRKLESQTQRLELLMAQTVANENILPKQPDPRTMHERISYADEGDEVVERVLGWIMKLFPGGPSRRQTSKHL